MGSLSSTEFYAYLISRKIITKEQLAECLKIQQELRSMGLPERSVLMILLDKKYLTKDQITSLKMTEPESELFPEIQGYTLQKKLGEGGMGAVYLARQISMDRNVAIKILSRSLSKDKIFIERFHREARASAVLNHRNIVSGIDVGESNGYHYFVMEYIQGKTVDSMLDHGPLTEKKALEIIYEIASALDHAHQSHFVHRDIKPENIMVTTSGEIKLLDFGLAKQLSEKSSQLTQENTTFGTPYYISPEQATGEPVDIRADIYSLGATLFHLVTGSPPFRGNSSLVIMGKHLNEPIPDPKELSPKLSGACANLIFRMMEKKPDKRFQTPKELLDFLNTIRNKGTTISASLLSEETLSFEKEDDAPLPKHSKNNTKVRQSQLRAGLHREKENTQDSKSKNYFGIVALFGAVILLFLFWGFFASLKQNTNGTILSENKDAVPEKKTDPEEILPEKKNIQDQSNQQLVLAQEQLESSLQKMAPNFELQHIPDQVALRESLKQQKQIFHELSLDWDTPIQQINERIDFLGERHFQQFSQESTLFLLKRQFREALDLWKSFPKELETSLFFQKARNAQEEVWLKYRTYFEIQCVKFRNLFETKQFEEAEQFKQELLAFCIQEEDRLQVEEIDASFQPKAKEFFREKQEKERSSYLAYFQEEFFAKIASSTETEAYEIWKKMDECETQYPSAKDLIQEDREIANFFFQAKKHLKQLMEEKKKIRLTEKEVSTAKIQLESLDSEDLKILFKLLEKGEKFSNPESFLWEQVAYGFFMKADELSWNAFQQLGESGEKYLRLAQHVEKQGKISLEKKAETLYKEAIVLLEKKSKTSQEEGRKILKNLLEHFDQTKLVQSQKDQILEKMKAGPEKKAPDKFIEKLSKVIHGKITVVVPQSVWRVDYDFTKEDQLEDFDLQPIRRDQRRLMDKTFFLHPSGGLFGNDEILFLWKPVLDGDLSLEFTCYPAKTQDIGCTLHYQESRGHFAYVSFEMFRNLVPWADGSSVLYDFNFLRLLDLRPTQTLKNPFPGLKNELSRTELSTNHLLYVKFVCSKDKLAFYVNEGPSCSEKPYLQGNSQNPHEGRAGVMSPYGALFTRISITGTFEKKWLADVLKLE